MKDAKRKKNGVGNGVGAALPKKLEREDARVFPHRGTTTKEKTVQIQQRLQQDADKFKQAVAEHSLSAVSYIEKLSQKRGTKVEERFKVVPDYAYPNTRMNREELRQEVNQPSSYFHRLEMMQQQQSESSLAQQEQQQTTPVVGQLMFEILQCFGLPKTELLGEASAFALLVCGPYAFRTDQMPPVANPMWLRKMRRACAVPLHHAYARVYVGVFGRQHNDNSGKRDGFAGRVVLDVARLRPGCTYDVTLPLRQSAHVYSKEQRGAIRVRFYLQWHSTRAALLSYWPQKVPKTIQPNESTTIACCDAASFQNVARTIYGDHMPGRFTLRQLKATVREINFTRIHVLRYLRKREVRSLCTWQYPLISGFVFVAWMHSVYASTVRYAPGHVITFLLLHLWKNYVRYGMDSPVQNGFLAPTWEEMFAALLWEGGARQNNDNQQSCRIIAPLEMERNDKAQVKSALQDMNTTTDSTTNGNGTLSTEEDSAARLHATADAFRKGVAVHNLRFRLRVYRNVFRGCDAVDFLVQQNSDGAAAAAGYAPQTRAEAVAIGERLMTELNLFEHVARKHTFKDEPLYYRFSSTYGDANEYTFKTHRPRGVWLFRVLGLWPETELSAEEAHLEMPYADGVDHPRFTVKESLVIRSKSSQRLLDNETMSQQQSSQTFEKGLDELLRMDETDDQSATQGAMDDLFDEEVDNGVVVEVKQLNKPPLQDIDVVNKGDKKRIADTLAEVRHKVHAFTFHLFNDRVYKIDDINAANGSTSSSGIMRREMSTNKSSKKSPSRIFKKERSRLNRNDNIASRKDEYNKLLGVDKYSHGNPWISKVGIILQPIVEIALEWLCLFRALFNIFTWRDPMLTFWVTIVGPVLVVILHFFPWRFALGLGGLVLFGPQNWVLRVMRERRPGYEPPDADIIIKKKKLQHDNEQAQRENERTSLFSNYAPDNRQLSNADYDASHARKVVVPYTQVMSQRFYDWPPESEYARVVAEAPPTSRPAEYLSQRSSSWDGSTVDSSNPSQNGKVAGKARKLLNGVHVPRLRRKKVSTY